MGQQVPFHITSGLPFGRSIIVTLPNGRDWWTAANEFEVLMQVRKAPNNLATLILDLTQFLTVTFNAPDTVNIDLDMTGADTRLLSMSGHYDVVMSDPFATDDRAEKILDGPVYRESIVTADQEEESI